MARFVPSLRFHCVILCVYSRNVCGCAYVCTCMVCRMGVILKTTPIPSASVPTLLLVKPLFSILLTKETAFYLLF